MLVPAEQFLNFLCRQKENSEDFDEIVVPYLAEGSSHSNWGILDRKRINDITFTSYRTLLPLKFLFYSPRETVYPEPANYPKRLIAGVKACDLQSLQILDSALLNGNFREPAYSNWRKNTLIIAADCSEITSSCHCTLLNGKPYSSAGYDINLSVINGYFLLTSGSEKGKLLLEQMKLEVTSVKPRTQELDLLKGKRDYLTVLLKNQNKEFRREQESSLRHTASGVWKEESQECVGCGACTNSCPTCYCLILNDESMSEEFVKVRSYDSCQWYGYARVAGGGTTRPKMHERFRNRYLCKFDYMQSNFDKPGCTGCGRCIESCTAGIDFRNVLYKTSEQKEEILFK